MSERLELEVSERSSSPELKLWAAVVALAIKDLGLKPDKNDKLPIETRSAFRFLLTDQSDWAFEVLDLDPTVFREKIYRLMHQGRDRHWRTARINHQLYWHLIEEGGIK